MNQILLLCFLFTFPGGQSAWEVIARNNPSVAAQMSSLERSVLERLDPRQLESYISGAEPENILLDDGSTLADLFHILGSAQFLIDWFAIGGGGGRSISDDFEVRGSIGRSDASLIMEGEGFSATGGYWAALPTVIFRDGFESGDTARWSFTNP